MLTSQIVNVLKCRLLKCRPHKMSTFCIFYRHFILFLNRVQTLTVVPKSIKEKSVNAGTLVFETSNGSSFCSFLTEKNIFDIYQMLKLIGKSFQKLSIFLAENNVLPTSHNFIFRWTVNGKSPIVEKKYMGKYRCLRTKISPGKNKIPRAIF